MGDRYILTVECPNCGFTDEEAYYAPTCNITHWICPKCNSKVDLGELTGISYEDCSNRGMIGDLIKLKKEEVEETKNMVLVCVFLMDGLKDEGIILVEKRRPDWQKGRLNLPGGRVKLGEQPRSAAVRELAEETGLFLFEDELLSVGRLTNARVGASVYIYAARWPKEGCTISSTPGMEVVKVMRLAKALLDPKLMDNLRYIIPRSLCLLDGYTEVAKDLKI